MTAEELNKAIEEFEINMLEMASDERFDTLVDLTRSRFKLTGQVYNITELLVILGQLTDNYVNLSLCRAICNLLFIHNK